MPNAIVLIIDGLQAGFVGCYGNSWVDTPALNRLAAEGCCFDFALADSVRIESLYRSFWSGWHVLAHDTFHAGGAPMLRELAAAGVRQYLVSDAAEIFPNELVEPFESHLLVPPPTSIKPAATIDATHTVEFFTAAIEQLNQPGESRMLWLHTQGLTGPWDAPLELREQLRDEDDLPPRDSIEPPQWILPADPDPDDLLQIVQSYAAQVMLLDHGIDCLLEALSKHSDTLLIVAGARGFALGEHGWVGRAEGPLPNADDVLLSTPLQPTLLHNELLHMPLLVRLPGARAESVRNGSLVQPADLYATLADWFELPRDEAWEHPARGQSLLPLVLDDQAAVRQLAVAADADADAFAARTDIWQLVTAGERRRLYVKPDDRWEVNDVADRASEVVEGLDKALSAFQADCQDPNAREATPLSGELTVTQD